MSHLPESIREAFSQILWDTYMERVTKNYIEYYFSGEPIATVERYFYERFTPPEQIMKDTLAEIIHLRQ